MTNDDINKHLESLLAKGGKITDEAHIDDSKLSKNSFNATSMLERMAAVFTADFKNMDDYKYRIFGKAYLQHELTGVRTGRFYDSGVHTISGDEAVKISGVTQASWHKESALTEYVVDYKGFINDLKQLILAGYTISIIALKIMDFFNVGTNSITYRTASYAARRLYDIVFMLDSSDINNRFWRSMATIQLFIKSSDNPSQHIGYTSETDLRGMSITCARSPTFTRKNHQLMFDNINSMYGALYA